MNRSAVIEGAPRVERVDDDAGRRLGDAGLAAREPLGVSTVGGVAGGLASCGEVHDASKEDVGGREQRETGGVPASGGQASVLRVGSRFVPVLDLGTVAEPGQLESLVRGHAQSLVGARTSEA